MSLPSRINWLPLAAIGLLQACGYSSGVDSGGTATVAAQTSSGTSSSASASSSSSSGSSSSTSSSGSSSSGSSSSSSSSSGSGTSSSSSSSSGGSSSSTTVTADVTVQIDASALGPTINRLVLGSNVQWVDGGDNMLTAGAITPDTGMQGLAQNMSPAVLRYPGGAQSDLYDWTRGIGPLAARGPNVQAGTGQTQITYMGSAELLELGQVVHGAALFTVNALSGTAAQAAAWVRQANVTRLQDASGQTLPKVEYWEIGNEPYLPNPDGTHPNTCEIDPVTYAGRINTFTQAMRVVDGSIKIGIALANDLQNGITVVSPGCKHFATTVLGLVTQHIDFISLHDAYLPYDISGRDHPANDEYLAAMASTESIRTDFAAMRTLLQAYPQFQGLPFAITEYNALFSFNANSAYIHSMASPMGALYVADALRLYASDDEVLMANLWSLSGNDHWGSIHSPTDQGGGYGRPTYEVFRLFNEVLQGRRLTAKVTSPTFDAPALGFSASATGLPLITTLTTLVTGSGSNPSAVRLLLINKDYKLPHHAAIAVAHAQPSAAHLSTLTAADVLESDDLPGALRRTDTDIAAAANLDLTLPAHSVTLLTLQFNPASP